MSYQDILDHHNSPEGQAEYKANQAKSDRISEQIEAELRAVLQGPSENVVGGPYWRSQRIQGA